MKLICLVTVCLFWLQTATALSERTFGGYQGNEHTKRDAPVAGGDGICFTYTVQWEDSCAKIAESHSVSVSDIELWNTGSWGWSGCANIAQGDFVCLSSGALPMPKALPNAVCGPQVPGAMRPANYADLPSVNPCPMGQCCSRWFQCGSSTEFCSKEKGCLSGCGAHTANSVSDPEPTTTSKQTTQTKDSTAPKPTTLVKSTSTTSTTKEVATVTVTTEKQPSYTWGVVLYEKAGCNDGNYMYLQGHDNKQECLVLSKLTATIVSDDTNSCRWWTKDGLEWDKCSTSDLMYPQSWALLRGGCAAYTDEKCQENGGAIKFKGCGRPRQAMWSPEKIVAIRCWDNAHFT